MQLIRVAFGLFALSGTVLPQLAAQAPAAPANTETPGPTLATEVRLAPGALQGRVLAATSRQPLSAHAMTLVDASGKAVQQLVTGADGVYHTQPLQPGSYALQVRDDLRLDLTVAADGVTKALDILVPPQEPQDPKAQVSPRPTRRLVRQDPAKVPAAPGGAAPAATAPVQAAPVAAGIGTGTWALIGAGAAAAIAVPVVAAQRSSSHAVSPVEPLNGRIQR